LHGAECREKLLRYAWGIIKNRGCHLCRVNAVEDHFHIFTHLHPTITLSDWIKEGLGRVTGFQESR
jgi:hypothetical protein